MLVYSMFVHSFELKANRIFVSLPVRQIKSIMPFLLFVKRAQIKIIVYRVIATSLFRQVL